MRLRGGLIFLLALIVAAAGVAALGLKAWPLTGPDRERLASMQSADPQPAHPQAIDDDRHYPIDMRPFADVVEAATFADQPFDENGIVHVAYPRQGGTLQYNPVTAAQYALGCYERYLHGDPSQKEPFLRHATWLRNTMREDGRLEYLFDVSTLKAPWISGMAQGQAMSVFVRAADLTGDDSWLDAARTAFVPLQIQTTDGGAMFREGSAVWLEEYPEEPPSHVFNGHVFAIFGVRDLALATGDSDAEETWRAATRTLADNLKAYENDGWLRYDLKNAPFAMRQYYTIQVDQTALLAEMSDDARLARAAERWEDPIRRPRIWLAKRLAVRAMQLVSGDLP